MNEWLEDPFKAVIGGTILIGVVCGALMLGISVVGAFV